MRWILPIGTAIALVSSTGWAQAPEQASATFHDRNGARIGTATLTETPNGVLIETEIAGLPAGERAFHIHETGTCEANGGFESAGSHFALDGQQHGFKQAGGPHAGDMPNQFVQKDGMLRSHVINPNVTLGDGDGSLFDDDGSALVIHAGPDDYTSQPSGDAGGRIACAVIERS
jgi:Cu-Zn family superoxide dismutase